MIIIVILIIISFILFVLSSQQLLCPYNWSFGSILFRYILVYIFAVKIVLTVGINFCFTLSMKLRGETSSKIHNTQPIYCPFHLLRHCCSCKYLTLVQRHAQNCISLVSCWNYNSVKANRIAVYENNKPKGKFDKIVVPLSRRFCSKQATNLPTVCHPWLKHESTSAAASFRNGSHSSKQQENTAH